MSRPYEYRHTESVQVPGARRVWRPDGSLVSDGVDYLTAEEFVAECNFLLASHRPRVAAPAADNILRFELRRGACAFCGRITPVFASSHDASACICPECVGYAKRNLAESDATDAATPGVEP